MIHIFWLFMDVKLIIYLFIFERAKSPIVQTIQLVVINN